jgi:NADH-quinone oxidoreductase subunit N
MSWMIVAPELYFFCTASVFFVFAMISGRGSRRDYVAALALATGGLLVSLASVKLQGSFSQVYRVDLFSQVFKVLLAMGFFLIVCICSDLKGIRRRHHPEFYLLLSMCTLAMMMLVSSIELLTIYVALELTSYSLYILVALREGEGLELEAGIKYFLIGAATSAVMLFGMASLYGATGETHLSALVKALPAHAVSPMVVIGLLFTLCGFFFKLALFPFHIWAPTVYQGASNQVTAYIATATKVAAIALLLRFATLGAKSPYLVHILVTLAIASMTLGNLAAIVQKDLKRLLAYSAVAQAGYVLIGVLSMSERGFAAAVFYAVAYMMMSYICFLVVVKVAQDGGNLQVVELAGLHSRSPLLAMSIMVGAFSLGGIPPTIGFTGKFLVFTAAMETGYFYLVLIAMINVAVSLYYYALLVKAAYFLEPETELPPISLSIPLKVIIWAVLIIIIAGGMYPDTLYSLASAAAGKLGN